MLERIATLYDYNRWANERVLGATSRLAPDPFRRDLGSSFPSVRDTLAHVLGAEWIWLRRCKGDSPASLPAPEEFEDVDALRARWSEVEEERAAFLAGLEERDLDRVVEYLNTRGERWAYPLWQVLLHVVNHSSYHRGQVTTMLRQLGAAPAVTDYLAHRDELSDAGESAVGGRPAGATGRSRPPLD